MALRTIVHHGTEWTVWTVVPSLETRLRVPLSGIDSGWLCFQSAAQKRRISPVPEGWEEWPEAELARQLDAAMVVTGSHAAAAREAAHAVEVSSAEGAASEAWDLVERVRRIMRGDEQLPQEVHADGEWVQREDDED